MKKKMIDKVKEITKKYDTNIKQIEYKYSKPKTVIDLEENVKKIENDLEENVKKIENDLEKLREKIRNSENKNNEGQIEEYIGILEQKRSVLIEEKEDYLKKNEFNIQEKIDRDKQKIKELGENETNTRRQFMEAKEEGKEFLSPINKDIQKVLNEMIRIKESNANKEEKDKSTIENDKLELKRYKDLKELYIKLEDSKKDIESAIRYCY